MSVELVEELGIRAQGGRPAFGEPGLATAELVETLDVDLVDGIEGPLLAIERHGMVLHVGQPTDGVGDLLGTESAGLAAPAGRELLGGQGRVPPPERHHLEPFASLPPARVEVGPAPEHDFGRDHPARPVAQVGGDRREPRVVRERLGHGGEPLEVDDSPRRWGEPRERGRDRHPCGAARITAGVGGDRRPAGAQALRLAVEEPHHLDVRHESIPTMARRPATSARQRSIAALLMSS